MTASSEYLERFEQLHPRVIDLSLGRIERLLETLDNPQQKLPPVVHVAGTNGKGSVIAFMRAILQAAGYRVQVFTSPHLVDFNERIRLSDGLIDENRLTEILARVEVANGGQPITVFEMITAAAFLAFSEDDQADILLLETGLGGRLDSTNVVAQPALTVITPISMDHMAFLGDKLAKIAAEKAGIMKPGVPAVLSRQDETALQVLAKRASQLGVPVTLQGLDFGVDVESQVFRDQSGELYIPEIGLRGRHQWGNAATAIAAIRQLTGFEVADSHIVRAMARVEWPARLQALEWRGKTDVSITLDGGHNRASAEMMAEWIRAENETDMRETHIVLGLLENRDPGDFLNAFDGLPVIVYGVPIADHQAHAPTVIADVATRLGLPTMECENVQSALKQMPPRSRVLICGSLYLAGQILGDANFRPLPDK